MGTYDKFNANLETVYQTIHCENERPVPCYMGIAPAPIQMEMTLAEYIADPVKGAYAQYDYVMRLSEEAGPIGCIDNDPMGFNMVSYLTLLWLSKIQRPGIELSDTSLWQVLETKIMEKDEYDVLINQGYETWFNSLLPKVIDMEYFGKTMQVYGRNVNAIRDKGRELGIVSINSPDILPANIPFEILCGVRSMSAFYMDCYKIPDKLVEASDVIFEANKASAQKTLEAAKDDRSIVSGWIGGWRTASAMLSPKIWDRLVWPYIKASGDQMLSYGKNPTFHLDQCWNRDIGRFAEFPEKSIILNLDGMTDMREARKKLGENYCLMGDVPAPLLATGTPEEVRDYVTKLIDDLGPKGLFVTAGCDAPGNTKHENMVAMFKATNDWK
ncbi:methyltransferase [Acetobacterium paludosum]|uniref:Methyltransferase n=1 Tax=Acetobacterium paludosum TaxID=52693 RepID=A0A923KR60_9FIRM|nr:uroporphyrinogen decarboxylase family protein [Acetobacterium paludosum]MBC3886912.1 methyltransferase [Acetobacterium paludosum]